MKYVGSKNRLSKELAPIIQSFITKDTKGYLEPFVGGCNMIDKIRHHTRIGCDINKYLIAMLNKFKEGYEPPIFIDKEEYTEVKNNIENYEEYYVGLVGFCATYNGGWMRRYGAIANTKIGKVRNYYQESVRNIQKQIPKLQNVRLVHKDFKEIENISGYVIYCDIPYKSSGWEMYEESFDYDFFYDWCKELSKNNTVLISEYDMPREFECVWEKEHSTSFDNKNNKKKCIEKLFKINAKLELHCVRGS